MKWRKVILCHVHVCWINCIFHSKLLNPTSVWYFIILNTCTCNYDKGRGLKSVYTLLIQKKIGLSFEFFFCLKEYFVKQNAWTFKKRQGHPYHRDNNFVALEEIQCTSYSKNYTWILTMRSKDPEGWAADDIDSSYFYWQILYMFFFLLINIFVGRFSSALPLNKFKIHNPICQGLIQIIQFKSQFKSVGK